MHWSAKSATAPRASAWLPLVAALLGILTACRSASRDPSPSGASLTPEAEAQQARGQPVPELRPGPPSQPAPFASDPLWVAAHTSRSEIDLERLANRESAAGLMEAVTSGGDLAHTGLLALPHAEDAELALGQLCDWIPKSSPVGRSWLLRAVHDAAAHGLPYGERLDASGWQRCQGVLAEVARDGAVGPGERDLAASARALIEAAR